MINFFNNIPQKERDYYAKITHIIGLNQILKVNASKNTEQFNQQEMFDFCRFNDLSDFSPNIQTQISTYSELNTGNTCLHIAAEYGNINMIKYILKKRLIDPNTINKNKDNPLFHTLRYSNHENFEKSTLLLSKRTNLAHKDKEDKYAFEVDLPTFTKSRVRVLEVLRQEFYARLSQQ